MAFRIGSGIDFHKFAGEARAGGYIKICGVDVEHPYALLGHSDADVGLHALVDAMLGAIAAGDIGEHFPPSDPKWKGADSRIFLEHAARLLREAGAIIKNIDITIMAEAPKITPYKIAMRNNISNMLRIKNSCVSVKATTTEGMGFLGRSEGIAAMAGILVEMML